MMKSAAGSDKLDIPLLFFDTKGAYNYELG